MTLSRRALLGAAGVGITGALSGCGTAVGAGLFGSELAPGTLTFWNLFGGGDGARLQLMLNEYAKQQGGPDSLQAATFTWGNPYYTKVTLATIGGAPPDVAVSHLTREKNLARAGLLTEITDDMLALVGLKPSDFNSKAWEAQKVDGKSYAIPLDTHPFVLYYNKDVCQKAGLLDSNGDLKPIVGTQGWEEALTAAKSVTGQWGGTVATVSELATPWRWFQSLYSQRTGNTPWLGDNGEKLTYNKELTLDTLHWMQKMTTGGLMPNTTDYAGSQTLMFTGKAGFYMQGEWEITTAEGIKDLNFGMVPIPKIYDTQAEQADSHTFILPKMDRTDAQVLRAMTFIKSMLDQGMTWAKGGHIPTYLPTLESSEYQALKPQSSYAKAADTVVYDAEAWYSGSGSTFENTIGAQIGLTLQGLATPEAALQTAHDQLMVYANTKSPIA